VERKNEMKHNKYALCLLVVLVMFLGAGQVFAATKYYFNLTVPRLGYSSTNNQAKEANCTNVGLWVSNVGGGFTLIAKAETSTNVQVGPSANVTTGSTVSFPDTTNCNAGQLRHVVFNSNYFVAVAIDGYWSPG
jgi:hypothetical protein